MSDMAHVATDDVSLHEEEEDRSPPQTAAAAGGGGSNDEGGDGRRVVSIKISKGYLIGRWALAIVGVIVFFLVEYVVPPVCRPFEWSDPALNQKAIPSIFPTWSLVVMCLIPILTALLVSLVAPAMPKLKWWELESTLYAGVLGAMFTLMMTNFSKVYAGRLRPDWVDRLNAAGYNATYPNPATTDYCAISDRDVVEGRLSFPSGHASFAFTIFTTTSLILLNRLRVFNQPRLAAPYFLLGFLPLVFGFAVALSRLRDNHHHHADVAMGIIIGFGSALVGFRLVFVHCPDRLLYIPLLLKISSARRTTMRGSLEGRDNLVEEGELPSLVGDDDPLVVV